MSSWHGFSCPRSTEGMPPRPRACHATLALGESGVGERLIDGLIDRLDGAEAETLVEPDGWFILSRHFEADARDANLLHAGDRRQNQSRSHATATMVGRDADILNVRTAAD